MFDSLREYWSQRGARLRDLNRRVLELSDDVALLSERFDRLNARMRKRASREAQAEQVEGADEVAEPIALAGTGTEGDRTSLRETLRERARAKGLMR